MWKPIIDFLVQYLKDKPFTDLLIVLGIGVFMWSEMGHGQRTDKAHTTLHTILQERDANEAKRDEAQERNVDRIVAALTGVKAEVKKTTAEVQKLPDATADKIAEKTGTEK